MNGNIRRVLKAPTQPITDLASLQDYLPLYASDKEDGIRCIIHPTLGPVSQKMLLIPNYWVYACLNDSRLCYLDGELIAVDCEGNECSFNATQSAIMSQEGRPRFRFKVFDWFGNQYLDYEHRLSWIIKLCEEIKKIYTTALKQTLCYTIEEIEALEQQALARGKEGLMLRNPKGWYKEGRSTLREAYLLKVKRFMDDEAVVIGLEEEMENCNAATLDAGGLQKRSKHQSGMRGKGCVGALVCEWRGKELRIASGMTQEQKNFYWRSKMIVGKTITFKYQAHGMKDLPRCPVFKGIRYD